MNTILRTLAQYDGLALLVSALLTSSAVVCVAAATSVMLRSRSARARSAVWRLAMTILLVVGAWRLMPRAAPPLAVVEWQVEVSSLPAVETTPVEFESPAIVLPEKNLWEIATEILDERAMRVWLIVAAVWMLARVFGVLFGLRALSR
ncbi:MAG: hypothetical protein JNG86_13120, partial [Verrucomicrobiaceae bacterium]|nr:hypothetical protein [Verrucomicrobiaceae bacterium]